MVHEAELAINQCSQYLPKPNPVFYTDTWAKLYSHKHDFSKAAICYLRLAQAADQVGGGGGGGEGIFLFLCFYQFYSSKLFALLLT